jgi:hypothetical protein
MDRQEVLKWISKGEWLHIEILNARDFKLGEFIRKMINSTLILAYD